MITAVNSPSWKTAVIQNLFWSSALYVIHPEWNWSICYAKFSSSDSTCCIIISHHPGVEWLTIDKYFPTLCTLHWPAGHFCIWIRPESITNCTPSSIIEQFQTPRVNILNSINQSNSFDVSISIFSDICFKTGKCTVTDSVCISCECIVSINY